MSRIDDPGSGPGCQGDTRRDRASHRRLSRDRGLPRRGLSGSGGVRCRGAPERHRAQAPRCGRGRNPQNAAGPGPMHLPGVRYRAAEFRPCSQPPGPCTEYRPKHSRPARLSAPALPRVSAIPDCGGRFPPGCAQRVPCDGLLRPGRRRLPDRGCHRQSQGRRNPPCWVSHRTGRMPGSQCRHARAEGLACQGCSCNRRRDVSHTDSRQGMFHARGRSPLHPLSGQTITSPDEPALRDAPTAVEGRARTASPGRSLVRMPSCTSRGAATPAPPAAQCPGTSGAR